MAITVTPTYVNPSNTAKNAAFAEGVSETAGTAETFETVFPASDETCYIMVKNGMCVFSVESGFVKNADGKVYVKVTPNSATTVKSCAVGVAAIYSGVTTA